MAFTKQMRKSTRSVHAASDALVNAKLFFALSEDSVWADGLLVFYEIFKFLEDASKRHRGGNVSRLFDEGMERTEAFENDLRFYLGSDWSKSYTVRDEVAQYLLHLQKLEGTNPDLLMAYIYHLYLGLLSGGQILTKKRQIKAKLHLNELAGQGYAITDFGDVKISELKRDLKARMEEIAGELTESERLALLEESVRVFELNNTIIKSVKGVNWVLVKYFAFGISLCLIFYVVYVFLWK